MGIFGNQLWIVALSVPGKPLVLVMVTYFGAIREPDSQNNDKEKLYTALQPDMPFLLHALSRGSNFFNQNSKNETL